VTIQIKATEQYFPVVLFILVQRVVQTYEFEGKIPKVDYFEKTSKRTNKEMKQKQN